MTVSHKHKNHLHKRRITDLGDPANVFVTSAMYGNRQ